MSNNEIPENQFSQQDLETWYNVSQELKKLRAQEIILRKKIFGKLFPIPKEGTNNFTLDDGFTLKGKHQIQRTIDEVVLEASKKELRKNKINVDKLVKYKPELALSEYRKLTAEEQKLFDQCLTIKPGTPSLEITAPKKKRGT